MCAVVPAIATGLSLFSGLAMRSAAQQQARQTYKTESANVKAADAARNLKVTTAGQNFKQQQAETAMKRQEATLDARRKVGAIEASGISGNLLSTLRGEAQREGGNVVNNLNMSSAAQRRNLGLQVQGYDAELGRRISAGQSRVNQAYSQIPSITQIALGAGSQALTYDWANNKL